MSSHTCTVVADVHEVPRESWQLQMVQEMRRTPAGGDRGAGARAQHWEEAGHGCCMDVMLHGWAALCGHRRG